MRHPMACRVPWVALQCRRQSRDFTPMKKENLPRGWHSVASAAARFLEQEFDRVFAEGCRSKEVTVRCVAVHEYGAKILFRIEQTQTPHAAIHVTWSTQTPNEDPKLFF